MILKSDLSYYIHHSRLNWVTGFATWLTNSARCWGLRSMNAAIRTRACAANVKMSENMSPRQEVHRQFFDGCNGENGVQMAVTVVLENECTTLDGESLPMTGLNYWNRLRLKPTQPGGALFPL